MRRRDEASGERLNSSRRGRGKHERRETDVDCALLCLVLFIITKQPLQDFFDLKRSKKKL